MKVFRCKECGGKSYIGERCLECDRNFWRYGWRRGWIQVFIPGIIVTTIGLVIQFLSISHILDILIIGYLLWCIGTCLIIAAITNSLIWGKKIIRKKFELLEEEY